MYRTRTDVSRPIAASLRDFGYPDVTTEMVKAVLDAWLTGARGHDLPHGVIGMMTERQIEDVEDVRPGTFARLEDR